MMKAYQSELMEDQRTIDNLALVDEDYFFKVGVAGVTKIRAYGEPGQYCMVPWFAVHRGAEIICRVPAEQAMLVGYATIRG